MGIRNNILYFTNELTPKGCQLIAVSKTQPIAKILEAYEAGQRVFGENKVQELVSKHDSALPKDIEWHLIGHLQRNKVKYVAPFVSLIHSVDSSKLLAEINKQGEKIARVIPCLAQVFIADEQTKFGFDEVELESLVHSHEIQTFKHIRIEGLMGMATLTEDRDKIRAEFRRLRKFFDRLRSFNLPHNVTMEKLSMGMSGDYKIAIEEGSTAVRIGTAIFGERNNE